VNSSDSGLYVLVLYLAEREAIEVGQRGTEVFSPGWQVYVGSAKRNLASRLARHCRDEKRLKWHIDYLRQHAPLVQTWVFPWCRGGECRLARRLEQIGRREAQQFGASDCRCGGHLLRVRQQDKRLLERSLREAGGWKVYDRYEASVTDASAEVSTS